jgi:hypothetical protein
MVVGVFRGYEFHVLVLVVALPRSASLQIGRANSQAKWEKFVRLPISSHPIHPLNPVQIQVFPILRSMCSLRLNHPVPFPRLRASA